MSFSDASMQPEPGLVVEVRVVGEPDHDGARVGSKSKRSLP